MPRSAPGTPSPLALLVCLSVSGGCDGSSSNSPSGECVVWSVAKGQRTGQIYVDGARASFSQGLSKHAIGWLQGPTVMVETDAGPIEAAQIEGSRLRIAYAPETVSDAVDGGHVTFHHGVYKVDFQYNSACSRADAAVGATVLFHGAFPPGRAGGPGLLHENE